MVHLPPHFVRWVLFGESAPPPGEGGAHAAFPGLVGLAAFGRAPDERGEERCMEMQVKPSTLNRDPKLRPYHHTINPKP